MSKVGIESDVIEKTKEETDEPKMYACVLENDDYTTFDFVMQVLMTVFQKEEEQAFLLTAQIHHEGEGVAGIYPEEIAKFKQKKAMDMAKEEDHPLVCVIRLENSPKKTFKM